LNETFNLASDYLANKTVDNSIEKLPDESRKLKQRQINQLDSFFRAKKNNHLRSVLDTIYEIDVLQSHRELLEEENFCLPEYSEDDTHNFEAVDCFHPFLSSPIPNSFKLERTLTTVFLTGPNMSGKSTFLKTVGILTYFAHLGLPVPAHKLVIPVLNGLFTTINVSDSLTQGFSHFYSEVNRLKEMSMKIQENSNLVVILDELFRGTNVKDAYEGTLLIVNLLSKIQGAFFFISTHILEVAEKLADSDKIDFVCFESILNIDKPIYDYKLKNGVSTERVGMQIIKSERIEEILTEIIMKQD
jgi:DNA mismatch repair ATPase MutS